MAGFEGVYEAPQPTAGEHRLDVVLRHADAVVRHPALQEDVSSSEHPAPHSNTFWVSKSACVRHCLPQRTMYCTQTEDKSTSSSKLTVSVRLEIDVLRKIGRSNVRVLLFEETFRAVLTDV